MENSKDEDEDEMDWDQAQVMLAPRQIIVY